MTEQEVRQSPRERRRRRLIMAGLVLALLTLGGVALAREALRPRSQPCLLLPEGADPGPVPVEGRASGRSGPLTLALAGDAMLGRGVNDRIDRGSARRFWQGLASALRGVDLFAFNLECAITDASPWGSWKKFRFKLSPNHAGRLLSSIPLAAGAAPFASLGNNHVLDFGPRGLVDTVEALDEAGVAHSGAGVDAAEAWRPAVITTAGGVRVGLLAVVDHCGCLRMGQWVAGRSQPGVAWSNLSGGDTGPLIAAVAALDSTVDVLVLSIHGGGNYLPEGPPPWMRELAEALVTAGADVVWGHSAHHVLPIEQVRGRHIIYGTGGLADDYLRRPEYRSDLGMIVRLTFSPAGAQQAEVVPIRIRRNGPRLLRSSDPDHGEVLRRAGRQR